MRVRTYYAKLCLIQISVPGQIVLVDPLRLGNLKNFIDWICHRNTLVIMHSARQDLEVLFQFFGYLPQRLFDTQIASALAGFGDQIGYAGLVWELLGRALPKSQTRTDWSTRPLSDAQLQYAREDVHYLAELYRLLDRRLADLDRQSWLLEECDELLRPEHYTNDPETIWVRSISGAHLGPAAQHRLKALLIWRERAAQKKNLPREWIARNGTLMEIARQAPLQRHALANIEGCGPKFVRRWGEQLLDILSCTEAEQRLSVWGDGQRLTSSEEIRLRQLKIQTRSVADQLQIPPALLANRKQLEQVVRGQEKGPLFRGWRLQVLGREILDKAPQEQP